MKAYPSQTRLPIYAIALTTLLQFALNVHAQQDLSRTETRVNEILSKMTLDEKLDYIGGGYPSSSRIVSGVFNIKAIPRLGLPWITMVNGPLGIQTLSGAPSTRYPAGLTLAATWSSERAFTRGKQMGRDARARGYHVDLGPGIDPYRTPLGGRNFEYNTGEDPFLGSKLVIPLVSGFQQQGVWANVKHYAANEQEYRRENINILVDERSLREIYLPPFEAAVKQGHAASVMGALNAVNGDFACESHYLDTQVLKKDWNFDGVLLSDYQGIHDGVKAANAGMDLDFPFSTFMNRQTLLPAIQSGQVTIATIDDKVRRILRKIISFGFLDRPQLDTSIPLDDPASSMEALNEAREGTVLLKNHGDILPLERNRISSIAVFGRLAPGIPPTGFGSSFLHAIRFVSELDGIRKQAGPNVRVDFISAGSPDPATAIWESASGGTPGLKGEYFTSNDLSGSPAATRIDTEVNLDWTQPGVIPSEIPTTDQSTFSVRWTGKVDATYTGDHLFKVRADGGVRLYVNGQLLIDNFLLPTPPPVYGTTLPVFAKIPLQAGQSYDIRLEYRRTTGFAGGSGSLLGVQFSWTPLVVPPEIASYDAVVMCQGIDNEYDGEGLDLAFKFEDQGLAGLAKAIILPEFQDELIRNVIRENPKTIVVLHGTGNFDIQSWINQVPGLLHAWYPGENGGQALAEILFGDINPSGKLPITMEKHLADNPTTANYPTTTDALSIVYTEGVFMGYRGYEKNHIQPQYPFGYGLSYTKFRYSDLSITPSELSNDRSIEVRFRITNIGQRAGAETAQLYVGEENPKVPRPIKELKGFQKVYLQPGESKEVTIQLNQRSLAFYNVQARAWEADPGVYTISVGASSQDIRLNGKLVNPSLSLVSVSESEPVPGFDEE